MMKRVLFVLGVLEDDDIDWLLTVGQRLEFHAGDVLIRQQQQAEAIYLLLDGTLHVSVASWPDQIIAELSSGEVVGEMSFVDTRPPSATVTAATPALLLAIPWSPLQSMLQQDSRFAARFYRALAILLSSRLRTTVQHLEGEHWQPVVLSDQECSRDMAETISLGGIRFDWLMRRLRDNPTAPTEADWPTSEPE
ncbi:hypothetical protein XM38_029400 [Halomicronema hongdechloris C2206]|uniref:Cyclic nucleotide-binding domain-containing protein n=1 Tax=Halomicronema hongdechloris C2206 TaxID=1641165 RepID=A0A1Z3HNX3_9CYAN|nr:cyclic nucleotide-binding domain-containing protein [Halomicronema hongdechloris]ASC71986.1 hypothetical protein XM38_029400 [Halomicronema hongdechloris C2206]